MLTNLDVINICKLYIGLLAFNKPRYNLQIFIIYMFIFHDFKFIYLHMVGFEPTTKISRSISTN